MLNDEDVVTAAALVLLIDDIVSYIDVFVCMMGKVILDIIEEISVLFDVVLVIEIFERWTNVTESTTSSR